MTTSKKLTGALLLLSLLSAPAGMAAAVDTKWIAGAWCIPEDEDDTSFITDNYGEFIRGTSSTRHLQCPILRDNTTNTTGLDSITMQVICPTNVTVSCTATSRNNQSSALSYATKSCTGGNHDHLDWDSDDITSSSSGGYYHISCTISGSSASGAIVSYEWVEP